MYLNLVEIGLKCYLDSYFVDGWTHDSFVISLNKFVGKKSSGQKRILKSKFSKKQKHLFTNDILHELMVACVFHPNADFLTEGNSKTHDLLDGGIKIEVKTINASTEENDRIEAIVDGAIRNSIPEDLDYKNRIKTKFNLRVDKAKEQIGTGVIYIIWNSDLVKRWEERKREIEAFLSFLVSEQKKLLRNIEIRTIYFEDLKEKISSRANE